MKRAPEAPLNLVEALVAALGTARRGGADGVVPPAAVLWTDPEGQWRNVAAALRGAIPEFLELGDYAPERRTGPAIWLRCVIDRTLDPLPIPDGVTPVVYLPGVARQDLRAGEECRLALRPLLELVHRGALWLHPAGHDWTVSAFLTQWKLEVGRDQETQAALLRALPELAGAPFETLRGKRLLASDFHALLTKDVVRELLRWMGEPVQARRRLDAATWEAFCAEAKSGFGVNPAGDDPTVAGEMLGAAEGPWAMVWDRFEEAPLAFPGVAEVLAAVSTSDLPFAPERWPTENARREETLRRALEGTLAAPAFRARTEILRLEAEHAGRRNWVWARLGMAPWAGILRPLAEIARGTEHPIAGATPEECASIYRSSGWQTDAAAIAALAECRHDQKTVVHALVRLLTAEWLDQSAKNFQRVLADVAPVDPTAGNGEVDPGGMELFVDGLRFDLGQKLAQALSDLGHEVRAGWRWAALPTVTATAKPASAPPCFEVVKMPMPDHFTPSLPPGGKPITAAVLRERLSDRGFQILERGGEFTPLDGDGRGWSEIGTLDERGHALGVDVAGEVASQLEGIVARIRELLAAGWSSVRVVTDHGWLLLPGGLPKVELHKHLTESRWARCAVIRGRSTVNVPTFAWHWNPEERFATAPGIGCFNQAVEYAHGGVSLQECLVPELWIGGEKRSPSVARITSIRWQGLRAVIRITGDGGPWIVDLRRGRSDGPSVANRARELSEPGEAQLLVKDDADERVDLTAVVVDPKSGRIAATVKTRVGVEL